MAYVRPADIGSVPSAKSALARRKRFVLVVGRISRFSSTCQKRLKNVLLAIILWSRWMNNAPIVNNSYAPSARLPSTRMMLLVPNAALSSNIYAHNVTPASLPMPGPAQTAEQSSNLSIGRSKDQASC
jgi:hypothetical protein